MCQCYFYVNADMLLYYLLIAILSSTPLCWCIQILAVFACARIIYIHLTVYGIDIVHMSILHVHQCVLYYLYMYSPIIPITLQVVHIRYMQVD